MKIIPGPASTKLAEKIAHLHNLPLVKLISKNYPDGESYIRLDGDLQDEDVVIVQSTGPPQDKSLVQLALIADAAKRKMAHKITAVVPYLAYARQDKVFLEGEALSLQVIAQMLKTSGITELLTVNIHQTTALTHFPFPAKSISAIPLLAQYFEDKHLSNVFLLAPDQGALPLILEAQKILNGTYGALQKSRNRHTGEVTCETSSLKVKGKTVIIFDDIISTGGTIISATKILKNIGAKEIFVACVHPLLIKEAKDRILINGVSEIVSTDSLHSTVPTVSLASILSKNLGLKE